jgi:hypothetical protein
MGCSSSCSLFEKFSTALEWIARSKLGIEHIAHVLDDFLFLTVSLPGGLEALAAFSDMCRRLGVSLVLAKTVGPLTVLIFLGIEFDTILMEARLPLDKLEKCRMLLIEFLAKEKATLAELQSLIGLLNFTVCVVAPGRPFLRRLIDLTIGLKYPTHRRRLTKEVKADLCMWLEFMAGFNGRSFFLGDQLHSSKTLHLFTDSSTSVGYGLVFGQHWAYGTWEECYKVYNIAILEFYPIVLALYLWPRELANKVVIFHTDNHALVHVINKQTAKEPMILALLRRLVLVCLKHNILFQAEHIPGVKNTLCDYLSRQQIGLFLSASRHSGMDAQPTTIERPLHHANFFQT